MSKEERDRWLELHKGELEKEEQEKLKEQMLDKDSQEELKKLASEIREKKLAEAGSVLNMAAEETKANNERQRIELEKAKENKSEK